MTTLNSAASGQSRSVDGPGIAFRQIEQARVFLAAEILRAKQFLQADDLRASLGGFANLIHGVIEICLRIQPTGHLNQSDSELFGGHVLF